MRTVLYANKTLSDYLRKNYVLHWKSVRPVPKITVDFGDGRVVTRTITGNAVHYILDNQGRLLDAIPGIYGPNAFQRILQTDHKFWQRAHVTTGRLYDMLMESHHRKRIADINDLWNLDFSRIQNSGKIQNVNIQINRQVPDAKTAIRRTIGKRAIEIPLVQLVETPRRVETLQLEKRSIETLQQHMDDDMWQKIAQLHREDALLDASSQNLIRFQNPSLALLITKSKAVVESPLLRMVRGFEKTLAVDTVRNEYEFHRQIHEWFSQGLWKQGLVDFNELVYSQIFLTPSSDPWLGLKTDDYTGLLENGLDANQ